MPCRSMVRWAPPIRCKLEDWVEKKNDTLSTRHPYCLLVDDKKRTPFQTDSLTDQQRVVFNPYGKSVGNAVKNAAGKLALPPKSLSIEFASEGFSIMPITAMHINRPREMSGLKGDPFNLILVAVADIEKMMLFTKQNRLLSFGIRHIKEA